MRTEAEIRRAMSVLTMLAQSADDAGDERAFGMIAAKMSVLAFVLGEESPFDELIETCGAVYERALRRN